jgi:hypothetical protein
MKVVLTKKEISNLSGVKRLKTPKKWRENFIKINLKKD